MTLELCNWVVHMGNWYKVLKGWGVRPRLRLWPSLTDICTACLSERAELGKPPIKDAARTHLLSWSRQ